MMGILVLDLSGIVVMQIDVIEMVWIDENGSLCVKPLSAVFPHVFLEATGVRWDAECLCLCSPKPSEWSYAHWFKQIVDAAGMQGIELITAPKTRWLGVDIDLRSQIDAILLSASKTQEE